MARPSRFSPRSEAYEALEGRSVGREDVCTAIVRGVTDAVSTGQARFDLVMGPRGVGKSHMIGLVEGRLRKALSGRAFVAGLPEELHPGSLVQLLAEILRALPSDSQPGSRARQMAILASHSPPEARDRAVGMIRARLQGLPLVIILENLDVVFSAIGRDGQHQLRSILQTERTWSVVATARSQAAAFSKESEPFFGTFIVRRLEPLSAEGCRDMLVRLARTDGREPLASELETPQGLARVQTFRRVIGGFPRAMAFISPHLRHERPQEVEGALEELAEELTPYFQEQMSRLSVGQRPIVELLAEHWNPMSVGEIAVATFTARPTVSTHLKHLREEAIVRCTKLGRERFYELSEPLFRIARAMKRADLKARTFLRVLQAWYELRGQDAWQLPLAMQAEPWAAPDMNNAYSREVLEPLLRALRAGRHRQVLDELREPPADHPLLPAVRTVALGLAGRDEESFAELASAGHAQLVIAEVWSIEASLAGSTNANEYLADVERGSMVGRLAASTAAIAAAFAGRERVDLRVAVEAFEVPLRAGSETIRRVATEVVLGLGIPMSLARLREHELCGRIVALLEPSGSGALSFNLAGTAVLAWAEDQIAMVFHQRRDRLHVLARGLGALAKLSLMLLAYDFDEDKPAELVSAIPGNLEVFLATDGLRWSTLAPADQAWCSVIIVLLMQESKLGTELPSLEARIMTSPVEMRLMVAGALHAGILQWVATGRDLTPIMASMSLERRLMTSLGIEHSTEISANPLAIYARLSAPERAAVRELSKSLGLDRHHAVLCELSSDEA